MDEHPFQQQRQLLREFRKAVTTRQQQEQEADRRRQTEQQDADRTLKQTLEQAKRHRDQEEGRITQKYQAALRTAEDARVAKRAQAERLLKETESETRSRYHSERKQADMLLEQTKGEARKRQNEETAQAQKRYDKAVKIAEEAWAQAQKLAADGQAKLHKDLKQCMDYLLDTGLSTALIPAEIPPAPPEGMTGDEDPAQMLEQSLRAVKRESEAVVKSVVELWRWRETWQRRRNWAIGIAVATAFVTMLSLSIRNAQVQEMNRQATATAFHPTYVAVSTATAQAKQATATAQAEQATATAQAEQATATAQAEQATATAQAEQATATAQAQATATVEAILTARPLRKEVTVYANQDWQDTGMFVTSGESVEIRYMGGKWCVWDCEGDVGSVPPTSFESSGGLVPEANWDAIIGRVGTEDPFPVSGTTAITAKSTGALQLRINDPGVHDNTGSILVIIQVK